MSNNINKDDYIARFTILDQDMESKAKIEELSKVERFEINSLYEAMDALHIFSSPYNKKRVNYYIGYEPSENGGKGHVFIDFTDEGKYGPVSFISREVAQEAIDFIGEDNLITYYFGEALSAKDRLKQMEKNMKHSSFFLDGLFGIADTLESDLEEI